MKCFSQPRFLTNKPIQITNILEVRLPPQQWSRIKTAAHLRRRTYSTITRYCTLRLARRARFCWSNRLHNASASVREGLSAATNLHRHLMCLYGDDEKLVRLSALDLGLTMTAFVRLAIELYLDSLAMVKHSKRQISNTTLTWLGIRFIESMQIFAINGGPWPFSRDISCQRFAIESYW